MAVEATDLDRVKAWLGTDAGGTSLDDEIGQLIPAVSRAIEQVLGTALALAERTEVYRAGKSRRRLLYLRNRPVDLGTAPVLTLARDRDFANGTVLTLASDYVLDPGAVDSTAYVEFLSDVAGPTYLQVVNTAGLAANTAAFLADATLEPITQAATISVGHVIRRRKKLEASSTSVAGGAFRADGEARMLPKVALDMLMPYMRRVPGA